MSLQTWMDEFYPTPAQKFPTELEAVEHSLSKWKGLTIDCQSVTLDKLYITK